MPYIGKQLSHGNYLKLDDISSSFNGSTTTFSLTNGGSAYYPGSELSILVSVGGVIQEPESAYQINNDEITFANPPTAQDSFFCVVLGDAIGINVPGNNTVNGTQLAKPLNYDGFFYLDDTDNRVGIHSASPTVALDVIGDIKLNGSLLTGSGGLSGGILTCTQLDLNGNGDVSGNFVIDGDLTVNGNTTTLDTTLQEVDRIEVLDNSSNVAVAITQQGSGDIFNLYDGSTEVLSVADGGNATFGGTLTIPSKVIHAGDTDTFMNFNENEIVFETGATSKVFINDEGDLTVGASEGNLGKVYIKQAADTDTEGLTLLNSGSSNSFRLFLGDSSGAVAHIGHGGSKQFNITQAGLVGIGVTNPSAKLQVSSGHINVDSGYSFQWGDSHERIEQSDGNIEFFTANGEKMRLAGSKLGIGITNPDGHLTINASSNPELKIRTSGTLRTALRADTGNNETILASHDGYPLVFSVSAGGGTAEKLRIDSTGKLSGIGTGSQISITNSGSNATEVTSMFYTSNSGTHNQVHIKTSTNNGGDPYIKFDGGGQDMIVGERYAGTTNNLLVMGPGLNPDTATAIFVKGTGTVGINTITMSSTLQVYGANDGEGTATGQITLKDTANYNQTPTGGIVFQGHHTVEKDSQAIFSGIRGYKANTTNGDYDGCLGFDVRKHGAVAYEAMLIDEDGNIHIKGTDHATRYYRDALDRYGSIFYDGSNFNIKSPTNDHTQITNSGGSVLAKFNNDTTVDFPGGVLQLGTADSSSGHISAYENMTFNIDTDNDDTNRTFTWKTNSSDELMRLGEDGKVGIATASAATTLDVQGDVAVAYNATHALRFYTQPRNNWSSISNTAADSNANLSIKVSQGEAIRILYNKKVGIGTDNPGTKLEVGGQISQSAIDVTQSTGSINKIFIYDTRMDSDGGAWRNGERAKATSWYNESLGTSDRGSRREFPVVAVLVLENYKLTIYDGDDPAMPMWMVFDRKNDNASTGWWDGNNSNYGTDVHCLNGYMYLTTHAAGGYSLNWISEEMRNWYVTTYSGARPGATIADRNSNTFPIRMGSDPQGGMTVSQHQQSVDMRVMDNAEIDHQTGLPQPHVLIGSSNDNANMVRIIDDNFKTSLGRAGAWTATQGGCYEARWDHVHGGYWHSHGYHPETSASYPNHGGSISYTPRIDISAAIENMSDNTRDHYLVGQGKGKDNTPPQLTGVYQHEGSHWTSASVANFWLASPESSNPGKWHIANNGKYFGTQHGLTVASHHLEEIPQYDNTKAERDAPVRRSLHACIGKDYATGYMFGNDKGCYGHQTSTTSLTAASNASLASDPTFENGHGFGSIQSSATVTHDNSAKIAIITSSGGSNIYAGREVTGLTSGQKYLFSLDFKRPSGSGNTGIILNSAWANSGTSYAGSNGLPADDTWRNMSCEFVAPGSSVWLNVYAQGTVHIDNFFIVPAANYESSKAYPARGARAYGTVTRVPVATGAELTMLSGTDNDGDFLIENNIDIDFSKDWYVMLWFPKGEGKISIERYNSAGNYNNTVCLLHMANGEVAIRHKGSPFNSFDTPYKFVCASHRGTTNTTYLWSGPGQLLQSHTGADWANTYMADLHIGRGSYNNTYSHTSNASATGVSLLRYGQGLPQREHLEKIYYDELALMQPDAKCTLYGSSNAITGMAWDKSTDIVHVGTSGGRSDFLGLRRINNTTVGTGMLDAKNGLIVEAT